MLPLIHNAHKTCVLEGVSPKACKHHKRFALNKNLTLVLGLLIFIWCRSESIFSQSN
ncbi:hypothetical protein THIOM_000281 [Candidatus Thiomargarita nelsonii]|uniref:Uncharacterized protein n=1 Tax=Candidatus Thiomargarita nelsonii TaxID=1003181 RepID=A0A176S7I1_9GAMM|nr:hypothetical protein THIOM_000281 [Candidatus Thiomargarita nelsonii]